MGHGLPDGALAGKTVTVFSMFDPAELAARLWSIVTFDRRGNVLWMDDFGDGLSKWLLVPGLAGTIVALTGRRARSGGFSLRIDAPPAVGEGSTATAATAYPVESKIGVEFAGASYSGVEIVELRVTHYDAAVQTEYGLRYRWTNDDISVWVTPGAWVVVADGLNLYADAWAFNIFKLVIDIENNVYVRYLAGASGGDLSTRTPFSLPPVADLHLRLQLRVESVAAGDERVYVDDVIVTQNEP